MIIERIIEELQEQHGATITKGNYYYNVRIWDRTMDVYQYLELTDNELIELYETYFKNN